MDCNKVSITWHIFRHPPTPAVSTFRQSIRQIIPTRKSVSATMPAYITAVSATDADSETRILDMSVGLAPFLVPYRRPRPVVRGRGEICSWEIFFRFCLVAMLLLIGNKMLSGVAKIGSELSMAMFMPLQWYILNLNRPVFILHMKK